MGQLSNKSIVAMNIKRHLRLKGERASDLSRAIDTPYSTVAEWVNGRAYPRIDKIEAMAAHFGVDKSDLIEEYVPHFPFLRKQEIGRFLEELNGMSYDELTAVLQVMTKYVNADDKTKRMVRMLLDLEDDHG